jgi:putative membrane protein
MLAHTQRHALVALVALGAVVGCRSNRADAANRGDVPDTTATAMANENRNNDTPNNDGSPDNSAWSDTKVLRIAMTANTLDSLGGTLALQSATSPAVKEFAQTMIRDHGSANKQARALQTRARIADSMHVNSDDAAQKMVRDAEDHQSELRKLAGIEFDKAYIDREIDVHQDVLDAIEDDLVKHAQNPELRNYLEQTRGVVASHLERAKTLKDQLNNGSNNNTTPEQRRP